MGVQPHHSTNISVDESVDTLVVEADKLSEQERPLKIANCSTACDGGNKCVGKMMMETMLSSGLVWMPPVVQELQYEEQLYETEESKKEGTNYKL